MPDAELGSGPDNDQENVPVDSTDVFYVLLRLVDRFLTAATRDTNADGGGSGEPMRLTAPELEKINDVVNYCRVKNNGVVRAGAILCMRASVMFLSQVENLELQDVDMDELRGMARSSAEEVVEDDHTDLLAFCRKLFSLEDRDDKGKDGSEDASEEERERKREEERERKREEEREREEERKRRAEDEEERLALNDEVEKLTERVKVLEKSAKQWQKNYEKAAGNLEAAEERVKQQSLLLKISQYATKKGDKNPSIGTLDECAKMYACALKKDVLEPLELRTFKSNINRCVEVCNELKGKWKLPWPSMTDKDGGNQLCSALRNAFLPIKSSLEMSTEFKAMKPSLVDALERTCRQEHGIRSNLVFRFAFLFQAKLYTAIVPPDKKALAKKSLENAEAALKVWMDTCQDALAVSGAQADRDRLKKAAAKRAEESAAKKAEGNAANGAKGNAAKKAEGNAANAGKEPIVIEEGSSEESPEESSGETGHGKEDVEETRIPKKGNGPGMSGRKRKVSQSSSDSGSD